VNRIALALVVVVSGCSQSPTSVDPGTGGYTPPAGSDGGHIPPRWETVTAPDDLDHGIADVFPSVVQAAGGDPVQIVVDESVDLSSGVALAVGGVPLTDVAMDGPRSLHAVVPKEAAGRHDLTVSSASSSAVLTEGFEFRHWTGSQDGIDVSWVAAVAVHPALPNRLFASTGGGVVFRSEDHGASWRELGHGLEEKYSNPLAVAPGDPNVLIAVCSGAELCRSKNGGLTWKPMADLAGAHSVLVDYDAKVVYAGGNGFFAKSVDDGRTWQVRRNWRLQLLQMALDPTTPGRIYGLGAELQRSDDGGATWRLPAAVSVRSGYIYGLGVTAAGTVILSHLDGVFRSTDLGESFTSIPVGPPAEFYGVARDPHHPGRILVGHTFGLLASDDDGLSFTLQSLWETTWPALFPTSTGELYAGTGDHGLLRVEADGTTTPVNVGLHAPTANKVAYCRGGSEYGSDYEGGLYRWIDRDKRWQALPPRGYQENRLLSPLLSAAGERVFWGGAVLDPGAASWRWAEIPNVGSISMVIADPALAGTGLALTYAGAYLTHDGGDTWQQVTVEHLEAQVGTARVTSAGTEYYAASGLQVYRLTPGAVWTPVGPPLPATAAVPLGNIAVSISGVVFANSVIYPNPKIFRLDPDTMTWGEVPGVVRPARGSPNGLGAAVSGRDIVVIGMDDVMLRTLDGGRTWIQRPLPWGAVGGSFVFDPDDDKRVLASMAFRGFMRSKNGGGFDE